MTIEQEDYKVAKNVLGTDLEMCCWAPRTGFFRDGYCRTNDQDLGLHLVCALMTEEFLEFSVQEGNDLVTPRPEFDFPGLKPGDKWCVCAGRWLQAHKAGKAPKIYLEVCHENTLELMDLEVLLPYNAEVH